MSGWLEYPSMDSMAQFLIQCVVVLYKQRPIQSQSLSDLLRICGSEPAIGNQIAIMVQDNSPSIEESVPESLRTSFPISLEYHHNPENPGLAYSYNRALDRAKEHKIPWLLLLDQDTRVTLQFLTQLIKNIQQSKSESCCAFVPQLICDQLVLSPQIVGSVFYRRLTKGFSGVVGEPLIAFNSAACIRVQALTAIGGFPEEFWLDYLDHMVFHSLQKAGGHVFVVDAQLEHSLSVSDLESNVSTQRYENVLNAEWMFVRKTGWGGGSLVHRLRLLKRSLNHFMKLRDKRYALQTLRSALT
jgi:GT2 family glycosyltransferase